MQLPVGRGSAVSEVHASCQKCMHRARTLDFGHLQAHPAVSGDLLVKRAAHAAAGACAATAAAAIHAEDHMNGGSCCLHLGLTRLLASQYDAGPAEPVHAVGRPGAGRLRLRQPVRD